MSETNKEFTFCLEQYDEPTKTAIVSIRPVFPINSKTTKVIADVSPYLAGAIASGKNKGLNTGDVFVGTKFTSTDNEREYSMNPFKLKHFIPDNKLTGIPEHFRLELVNEREGDIKTDTHISGVEYTTIKQRSIRAKFYRRYVKCITSCSMANKPEGVRVVAPQITIV